MIPTRVASASHSSMLCVVRITLHCASRVEMQGDQPLLQELAVVGSRCPTEERFQPPLRPPAGHRQRRLEAQPEPQRRPVAHLHALRVRLLALRQLDRDAAPRVAPAAPLAQRLRRRGHHLPDELRRDAEHEVVEVGAYPDCLAHLLLRPPRLPKLPP